MGFGEVQRTVIYIHLESFIYFLVLEAGEWITLSNHVQGDSIKIQGVPK